MGDAGFTMSCTETQREREREINKKSKGRGRKRDFLKYINVRELSIHPRH